MAGIKEIRTRIDSVQQTLKITNAMYLISSSKLRKARQQLNNVQPYFLKISSTIADILHHSLKSSIFISTSGPRSSAASPATLLSRATRDWPVRTITTCCVWPRSILRRRTIQRCSSSVRWAARTSAERDIRVDGEFMFTVQDPTIARARDIADIFIRLFREGQLDDVYVVYTEMVTPYAA